MSNYICNVNLILHIHHASYIDITDNILSFHIDITIFKYLYNNFDM